MSSKKRKNLTLIEKLDVLKETKCKSQRDVASKFGISVGSVNRIVKRKQELESIAEMNHAPNAKRIRSSNSDDVNGIVLLWIQTARAKHIPVSGPLVQAKALEVAKEKGLNDFKASNGWLEKFRQRHNIRFNMLSGESAGVNPETVATWKKRLESLIEDYSADDIFNCDETGLFYRAMPNKSLLLPGESGHGTKVPKDRLTILLGANMSGTEKLKPLVIGKSKNPRCFKHKNQNDFPVTWRSNKKAWMTSALFEDWISDLNKEMKKRNKKILLFVDNATSHSSTELSNVTLKFFPANCTSELQPMDQGIIKTFKAGYRKQLLQFILAKSETEETGDKIVRSVNVLESIYWMNKAWNDILPSTIQKCFARCGFTFGEEVRDLDIPPNDDLQDMVHQASTVLNIDTISTEEYLELEADSTLHIGDEENWEKEIITCEDTETNPADSEEQEKPIPTKLEVAEALEKLKAFCASDLKTYESVVTTEALVTKLMITTTKEKQAVLTDFFKAKN